MHRTALLTTTKGFCYLAIKIGRSMPPSSRYTRIRWQGMGGYFPLLVHHLVGASGLS
jgi:hypothetical protein